MQLDGALPGLWGAPQAGPRGSVRTVDFLYQTETVLDNQEHIVQNMFHQPSLAGL